MTAKTETPTTHDYGPGHRHWGHDYAIDKVSSGGQRLDVTGWGTGIREGDFLLLANGDRATRYRVVHISYYRDPMDMWRADLEFAPRP